MIAVEAVKSQNFDDLKQQFIFCSCKVQLAEEWGWGILNYVVS